MIKTAGSLFVVAALLMGVVGCQSGDLPGGGGAPAPGVDDPARPDDQGRSPSTVEECLSARWLLNNESWRLMLQPVAAASGATAESVTGEFVLDLRGDGTYSSTYTGWTVTTAQTGGVAVIERNGTDAGQWAISGDTVELFESSAGSAIEGYVESGGQRNALPSVGTASSGSFEVFEYLCGPDDLLATIDMGTVFFTLHP